MTGELGGEEIRIFWGRRWFCGRAGGENFNESVMVLRERFLVLG